MRLIGAGAPGHRPVLEVADDGTVSWVPTVDRSPGVTRSSRLVVPTRMGGSNAPDDLALGHVTQVWLAVSAPAGAALSGECWHHQRTELARLTDVELDGS